jgi:triosephosphate isomerase (TIM)
MRRQLIAGNWKMNLRRESAVALARAIAQHPSSKADIAICPPFAYLESVAKTLSGSRVTLGAQNASQFDDGAYTGEVSCAMLVDCGCQWVILGHSERRTVFAETDAQVNAKVLQALAAGLRPIVCVGEHLAEREAGQTFAIVRRQLDQSLAGLSADQMRQTVIAYEPIWAIGTGKVATPAQAQEVHADLRKQLEKRYNSSIAQQINILYGGSVKPENAQSLMGQSDIDGALVGGASLTSTAFLAIADACP